MLKRIFMLCLPLVCLFGCNSSPDDGPRLLEQLSPFNEYSGYISQLTPISSEGYTEENTGSNPILTGIDIADMPIPTFIEEGKTWILQENVSDDFNYDWKPEFDSDYPETPIDDSLIEEFGPSQDNDKWYNSFQEPWHGPGVTYYQYDHVKVEEGNLVLFASRNEDIEKGKTYGITGTDGVEQRGVNTTCVTSTEMVQYPVFVEAKMSVADLTMASNVWMLSEDLWQEIDIIECYGSMSWFEKYIHLSHHYFRRSDDFESLDFEDYQPTDKQTWWETNDVDSWGKFCRDQGEGRQYFHVGLHWISPVHLEYYVNGELVRVLFDRAFATKMNGSWLYSYPTMTENELDMMSGYQRVVTYERNSEAFSFETLYQAAAESTVSVIDPHNYQPNEAGLTKDMYIIFNFALQGWHAQAGRSPSDENLSDETKNNMMVDWLRVYKPIAQ